VKTSTPASHFIRDRHNNESYYEEHGFRVLGNLNSVHMLTDKDLNAVVKLMKSKRAFNIFDQDIGEPHQRKQFNLYTEGFRSAEKPAYDVSCLEGVHDQVLVSTPGDKSKVNYYPSLLYSPGTNDVIQLPHHDLSRRRRSGQSYLILVALMDETSIIVLHRSHTMEVRNGNLSNVTPVRILMSKGDYMMFHPSLVHSGDAYQKENVRMHYYVLTKKTRLEDMTAFPSVPNMCRATNPRALQNLEFLRIKADKRSRKALALANRSAAGLKASLENNKNRRETSPLKDNASEVDESIEERVPTKRPALEINDQVSARDQRAFNRDLERRICEEVEEIKKSEREFMAKRAALLGNVSSGRFLPSYEPAPGNEPGFIGMPRRDQSEVAFTQETLPRALGIQSLQHKKDLFCIDEDDEGRVVYVEDDE